MNVQDFISSGILEAYVMGAASSADRAEVEAMASRYPEVKAELQAIEEAMEAYAFKHAVEPAAHLKTKILNAITDSSEESNNSKEFRIDTMDNETTNSRPNVFAIAASVALLISVPLNIYLYTKVSSDESQITAMNDKVQAITHSIADSVIAYQQMRNKLYVLTDPMFKMIPLKGQKVAPDAKAMVCWCPDSKELYFEPEKLPATPAGMQYQLWAIVDGKPVDAGMVTMAGGMQKMKLIAHASAFAITLEKQGGSDTPHGDMYAMGTI